MQNRRAASLCSLERVVRLPAYRGASGRPEPGTATPAGERGRCRREGTNEAVDEPKEGTDDRSARAGTNVCWREVGADVPPATEGTGTRSPSKNPALTLPVAGPNESKLSDGGWRRKTKPTRKARRQPLFAGARG